MKSFLGFLCVILAVFVIAQADECTIGGHTFKVGQTYSTPGECIEYKCNGPNSFSGKTCPSVRTLEPCKRNPGDKTKAYPQCCPRTEC